MTVIGYGEPVPGTYGVPGRLSGRRGVAVRASCPPGSLAQVLFDREGRWRPGFGHVFTEAFPEHPEVIAVHALSDRGAIRRNLDLVARFGPALGPATSLILAPLLAAEPGESQLEALDLTVTLAAAGVLRGAEMGDQIGALVADGARSGRTVFPQLITLAQVAPGEAVWPLIAAVLPYVLDGKPAGLPDLLAVATDLAGRFGDGTPVPGLAEFAARPGAGRVLTQARRLLSVLV